jgi:hypothetical protein
MIKRTRIPITEFAPAERVPIAIARRQAARLGQPELPFQLIDSERNYLFILNPQRQIVFASRNLPELLRPGASRAAIGMRVGEVLGCTHAEEAEGGCGTSRFCRKCGAIRAVLESLAGEASLKQFRLTRFIGGQNDNRQFLALAAPLVVEQETFSLLVLTDTADGKSKQAMRRVVAQMQPLPLQLRTH